MVRHIFHSILGIGLLVHAAAHAASIRIMPLGDSITHGYWSGIETDYNSYRKVLRNLLEDNGYAADFMGSLVDGDFPDNQHEGQDGYYADHATKTNTVLRHVEAWITAGDADILLLHIGTSDIKENNADANPSPATHVKGWPARMVIAVLFFDQQKSHPPNCCAVSDLIP